MRFTPCGCSPAGWERAHRRPWMRWLLKGRRLYHCNACDAYMLLPQVEAALLIRSAQPAHSVPQQDLRQMQESEGSST